MVAIKYLFLSAFSIVSVLGQADPTGDAAAAEAYWNTVAGGATLSLGDPPEKRDLMQMAHAVRNDKNEMKDPYWGSYCCAPYTAPPCATKCNRNNCFRGFLNARDGSDGKHCPKEAFGFCCAYNKCNDYYKYWAIKSGWIWKFAPYAKNCKNDGDSYWDVLNKLNDVCGCTLNHEVTVDTSSAYYGLRHYWPKDKHCK